MIDILTISRDAERLGQLVRLIAACGNYRTTRVEGSPAQLLERGDTLGAFDVLIVDAPALADADPDAIAELCLRHKRLTCIMLTSDTSSDTLISAMRSGFRDVLNWPLEPAALRDALHRAAGQRASDFAHTTPILSFMSSRGGVGTSFIAANVAYAIATVDRKRVLLVDLNQQFADAAFLVTSATAPSTIQQMSAQIERMDVAFFDASVVHAAANFDILAGAGDPVKASEIRADRLEWILGVATPRYDFVVVDLGQTVNQLSMLALDRSDYIHVVLHASMPHLQAGRRLQEILGSLGYGPERMRLILNRDSREGAQARAALEKVLGMSPYHVIPDDPRAAADSVNQGLPVLETAPRSTLARSVRSLAAQIASRSADASVTPEKGESFITRLMGRRSAPAHTTFSGEQRHVAS
ncbi:AAA family ATPase [Paraburkholderia pallida]|uniref:Pilus assembly protein n=1 Tax=Paraburkholderia pallida TaxID=2547399 RepID=A0A4P7CW24_9BURK|nr:AAA family ATPase [Paraburkholderia pallida]QBQ98311.1 pilus assembly protein [Paraburkholderia pallida]